MNIETKYSGETDINESNIIQFEQGLPSFEEETSFVLLPFSEEPSPFFILQSTNTPGLALVVMTPFTFFPDYQAKLSDQTVEALDIEDEQEVALFVVLTLKDALEESTANLRGPIVMNRAKKKGKQIVLNESSYHTKHSLEPVTASGKKED
ncbi:flagellar assembly protein FliW [Salipaludibacillus keqinensis]|uniref:Flagellar assembly factor FliW n=1 Tax=Salipaludibacillus keqinensis TaxID=2045207 RepID=A0A323TGU8_9BACI|nr:flagellar assembly protein FliW [Salipaludibacillus keqinensis]PYZ92787.1 flagellar assembly protein FliW [Salipaludibacillus keqinensis]